MFSFYGNNVNIDIITGFPPPMPVFSCGAGERFFGGMLLASLFGKQQYETPANNPSFGFSGYDLIKNSTSDDYNFCPCPVAGYDLFAHSSNSGNYYTDFRSPVADNTFAAPTFDSQNYFNFTSNVSSYNNWLSSIYTSVVTPSLNTKRASNKTYNMNRNLVKRVGSSIGETAALTAQKYLGYKESNGSYKLFTGGKPRAWCADFVTYVVNESYRNMGKSVPRGFGSSSVYELREWGKKNNSYVHIDKQNNKKELLKQYVKVGDIAIYGTNKSETAHTGIITSINYETGEITAINGNSKEGDVSTRTYNVYRDKYGNKDIYLKGVVMLPS